MKYVMLYEYFTNHDEILDKISKSGIDSLTDNELNILKNVNINTTKQENTNININIKDDVYYDNDENIKFKLLKTVMKNGVLYFNGKILFEDEVFTGHILYDEGENYYEFEFYTNHNESFDPKDFYKEWEEIMKTVIDKNKNAYKL